MGRIRGGTHVIRAAVLAILAASQGWAGEAVMEITPRWEYVADTVMGGVSTGEITEVQTDGRSATRLTGNVSLDNNGGFIQMATDLADGALFDASGFDGIEIEVQGNGARYDLRLRTDTLTRPWQSFRVSFVAPDTWSTVRVAFPDFVAHRTEVGFDPKRLRRLGILAIGSEMRADISVAAVRFYRD